MTMTYRMCRTCDRPRVENCGTCFGFGVYPGETILLVPIPAVEEDPAILAKAQTCPECGGTLQGIQTCASSS